MHRIDSLKARANEERTKEFVCTKINDTERDCLIAMFTLYDIGSQGHIAVHHARKLLKNMGFEAERISLGTEKDRVTLRDLNMILESELPQPQPSLPCSLYTFDRIVGKRDEADLRMKIRPDEIRGFMTSIGRQNMGEQEISVLLSKMLAVDDVSQIPAVVVENFDKAVITFAKRNHIYKDANFEDPFAEKKQKKAVAVGDGTKIRVSEIEETNEPSPTANFAAAILSGMTDELLLPKGF